MGNFDLQQFLGLFSQANISSFFFKAFSVIFVVMYLIFAVVIFKQTQVMIKTISGKNYRTITLISGMQILLAIFLLLFALVI